MSSRRAATLADQRRVLDRRVARRHHLARASRLARLHRGARRLTSARCSVLALAGRRHRRRGCAGCGCPPPLVVLAQLVVGAGRRRQPGRRLAGRRPATAGASSATASATPSTARSSTPPRSRRRPRRSTPLLILGGCVLPGPGRPLRRRAAPGAAGRPAAAHVYSVPVSMLGGGVPWWSFALTAVGFLADALPAAARADHAAGAAASAADRAAATSPRVGTGAVRHDAGALGGVGTALAVVIPLFVPTLTLSVSASGRATAAAATSTSSNPMVDLRRDLLRGEDRPLLRVTTDDPDPSYLRIARAQPLHRERVEHRRPRHPGRASWRTATAATRPTSTRRCRAALRVPTSR